MRIVILFFILFAFTAHTQNNLSLSSSDGNTFKVILKGKAFNEIPQAHLLLEKIKSDTLNLELEFENKKKFPATIYFLEKGLSCQNKEFNYRVISDGVHFDLRFTGINEITPLPDPLVPKKPFVDTSLKYKNQIFGHLFEMKEGKPGYYNNLPKEGNCITAMPPEYMDHIALLISKTEVQDQKYAIVENVSRNNCLSVAQLGRLLSYVEYEVEKLKLVRLSYSHLIDPLNKKNLEKNFRLEASVNELNNFFKTADTPLIKKNNSCVTPASEMIISRYADKLSIYNNDTERIEALKKGYADLCYSSDQALQLLSKFFHDREKLEVAKLLYFNCVDKDQFLKVSQVFSYNQTTSELKDFMEKQGQ